MRSPNKLKHNAKCGYSIPRNAPIWLRLGGTRGHSSLKSYIKHVRGQTLTWYRYSGPALQYFAYTHFLPKLTGLSSVFLRFVRREIAAGV